ncbi:MULTISPECIES: spore germination protein [Priestia]|uniref:spore germination protein n=1 Tax=Priestia TaxID=2800373 RepID=UPI001C8DAB2F|nr:MULTISPECIES: spore germination protein [Priestia]MBY0061380.1 spore germination protein [Priestia aryabhattai]MDN3361912.1 spore germination protein [Priestia megaterium]
MNDPHLENLLTKDGLCHLFEPLSDVQISSKYFTFKDIDQEILLIYAKGMVDSQLIYEFVLPRIFDLFSHGQTLNLQSLSHFLEAKEIKYSLSLEENLSSAIFSGQLLLFECGTSRLYAVNVAKLPQRSVDESNMEVSIRGPRDGFVESIEVNIALIRQRLKTMTLVTKSYTLGTRSNTTVTLLYMKDIIDSDILKTIKGRLNQINTDVINSSYQVEELLYDRTFSLFPLLDYSGRPDYVAQSLNQGRFAILIDGSPSCLIGPVNLELIIKSPEDNQLSFFYASISRTLRLSALVTTILLPGIWTALTSYQPDQIPFPLLATVSVSRQGLPLSGPLELFIMLVFFELFKEAGIRLPKSVGQTVAVLGGLIVGDAAIRAGLTSPSTLVIGAVTVISSYTLVNQNVAGNILIVRFFIFGLSSFLGLYGFFVGLFFMFIYLASLESFGYPYMVGFQVLNRGDLIKSFLKAPFKFLKERNHAYSPIDPDRQKE